MDAVLVIGVLWSVLLVFGVTIYCLMTLYDNKCLSDENYMRVRQKATSWFVGNRKWHYQEIVDPITDVTSATARTAGNLNNSALVVSWENINDPNTIEVSIKMLDAMYAAKPLVYSRPITFRFNSEDPFKITFKPYSFNKFYLTKPKQCYKLLNKIINSYRLVIRYKPKYYHEHTEIFDLIPPTLDRKD